ncbi:MAG: cation transporter [Fulvivirga sp.]
MMPAVMENPLVKERFEVAGMTCASCASSVKSILSHVEGVKSANVNFADSSVLVQYEQDVVTGIAMQDAVKDIGYELILNGKASAEEKEEKEAKKLNEAKFKLLLAVTLSIPVLVIAMFFPDIPYADWIMLVLQY